MDREQNQNPLPPDDPRRNLVRADPESGNLPHLSLVGNTYTVLITGEDTAGRFSVIDMHVPPGGGPPPHRHDFEETFSVLEGQVEFTFRGSKHLLAAGEAINIPANAPHQFRNSSTKPARLLCICSPPGQEEFFMEVGIPVPTRTTAAVLDQAADEASKAKAKALAAKYRTELLPPPAD